MLMYLFYIMVLTMIDGQSLVLITNGDSPFINKSFPSALTCSGNSNTVYNNSFQVDRYNEQSNMI